MNNFTQTIQFLKKKLIKIIKLTSVNATNS